MEQENMATPVVKEQKGKGLVIALAAVVVLALAGIGASIYLFIKSNNQAAEITSLKSTISQNETDENPVINPILSSTSSQNTWSTKEELRLLGEGTPSEMSEKPYLILKVRDGIIECQMGDRILPDETCTINGLENKVYKMVSISEGHDGGGIGFITENGDVYFLSVYVALPENNAFYPEKLDFNKKVVDILSMDSMDVDRLTGGMIPVAVFEDGTYSSFSVQ